MVMPVMLGKGRRYSIEFATGSGSALISFLTASKIEKNAELMSIVRPSDTPRPRINNQYDITQ